MKKCNGCHQEIDKYTIACQYCGKLAEEREKSKSGDDHTSKTVKTGKKPEKE